MSAAAAAEYSDQASSTEELFKELGGCETVAYALAQTLKMSDILHNVDLSDNTAIKTVALEMMELATKKLASALTNTNRGKDMTGFTVDDGATGFFKYDKLYSTITFSPYHYGTPMQFHDLNYIIGSLCTFMRSLASELDYINDLDLSIRDNNHARVTPSTFLKDYNNSTSRAHVTTLNNALRGTTAGAYTDRSTLGWKNLTGASVYTLTCIIDDADAVEIMRDAAVDYTVTLEKMCAIRETTLRSLSGLSRNCQEPAAQSRRNSGAI